MGKKATKKKYRIRKGRVILAAVILTVTVAGITAGISALVRRAARNKDTSSVKQNVTGGALTEESYIRIEMEDCNMYVGNILHLKCVSEPEEYASMATWKSSADDIVSVNSTGDIIVKSVGMAKVTVSYGSLSDYVIINAIDEDDSGKDRNLPVYSVSDDGQATLVEPASLDGSEGNGHIDDESDYNVVYEPTLPEDDDGDDEAVTSGESYDDDRESTPEGDNDNDNINDTISGGGNSSSENRNDTEVSEEDKTDYEPIVLAALSDSGFSQYLGDTYIYTEDGNYLGEAIVGSNCVQIYVMTRTSDFDAAVKNVISAVLPDSVDEVFGMLAWAADNETVNLNGHMVRVIAPAGGGHSQLMIYY